MTNLSYISPKAAVRSSPIHGRGLFALQPIAKDEIVCVKGGYIFDRKTLSAMPAWFQAAEIQIEDDLFVGPLCEEEQEGCKIFSNHSCEPNVGLRGQVTFVAMRDIEAGEELTHDWAMTDDDDAVTKCNCGRRTCRGAITGRDWQRPDLQRKYSGYFSSYLATKIEAPARRDRAR